MATNRTDGLDGTMVATPEIELVALSTRELDLPRRARLKELAGSDLNWEAVLISAAAHAVTPLLYRALSREVPLGVPSEIERQLQARCRQIAITNLIVAGELDRICREFQRNGVRVLCLKGPTLAMLAYGDLSLRQFSDLDLMIDDTDLQLASQVLTSMGYRLGYDLSSAQHSYNIARYGEALYRGDKVDVDLHIRLLDERFRFALTFDELWHRRQRVTVAGGSDCWTISNEDLCLYLSVHGAKHCWERLSWIRDMTFLLHPVACVDWMGALSRARHLGCERIVLLGLSLAEQVCGTELPELVAAQCHAHRTVQRLTDQVMSCLLDPDRKIGTIGSILFGYHCRGRLGEVIRWTAAMTFLPHVSDWRQLSLPRPLWFLYPLLRPLRLAAKYASRAGRK